MQRLLADLHTHSVASGHAYSTINELAAMARERGLQAIAVTDHGPAIRRPRQAVLQQPRRAAA